MANVCKQRIPSLKCAKTIKLVVGIPPNYTKLGGFFPVFCRASVVPSSGGAFVLLPRRRDEGLDDVAGRAVWRGDGTNSKKEGHNRCRVANMDASLKYWVFIWQIYSRFSLDILYRILNIIHISLVSVNEIHCLYHSILYLISWTEWSNYIWNVLYKTISSSLRIAWWQSSQTWSTVVANSWISCGRCTCAKPIQGDAIIWDPMIWHLALLTLHNCAILSENSTPSKIERDHLERKFHFHPLIFRLLRILNN